MLDLNNPQDARKYIGEMTTAGVLILAEEDDYRYLPDDKVLKLAELFFAPAGAPKHPLELH